MNIDAFFKVSYGLYIVCAKDGNIINGHISNTVFQVTAEPAKFAVCTNKDNLTTEMIARSKAFSISILEQNVDIKFIGQFGFRSGREIDKFEGINYKPGISGSPIVLDKTVAYIDCKVVDTFDVGSHVIFIGLVVDSDVLSKVNNPLTYSYYRDIIKGVSPKNAPTYVDKRKRQKLVDDSAIIYPKYRCTICGHIYDPTEGDPAADIMPITLFEELPDTWICPVCGVPKENYEKIE